MSYNRALTEQVQAESRFIDDILSEVGKVIVGQPTMVERLLIGLLARGTSSSRASPASPRRSPSAPSAT